MRLSALTSSAGMYAIVSYQPVARLIEQWELESPVAESVRDDLLGKALAAHLDSLPKQITGIAIDREWGLGLATTSPKPLILPLESQPQAAVDPLALPQLDRHWGVPEVANNYAIAKFTLHYHPKEELALKKKQLLAELADHCRHEGIDLILDLVIYTPAGEQFSPEAFQAAQLQAVQELRDLPSAVIAQYPLEPLACATLTTELDIPWILSGRGFEYDDFKPALRTALEGGAAGFYLDELAWYPEPVEVSKQGEVENAAQWLELLKEALATTTRDQLIEVARITNEFGEG